MQTFMPYPNFLQSLECLDDKRLGKQRVEAMQILNALAPDGTSRWKNHPAVKMWRGHENALKAYHNEALRCWIRRNFKNTMEFYKLDDLDCSLPDFMGNEAFHRSHQSNLVRKNPEHYGKYFPWVPANLPYMWPV